MPDRPQEHHAPDPTRATPRGKRGSAARRVGHYRIDGEIGRGGMGVVYRAFDERLHRDVALKALPEDLVGDREQLARLEREARALALVSHPNVAAIHGMEQAEGTTYLVLELVTGETLRERLDRGALEVDEALALCGHVATGLGAVHRKGLVHRDLKPSNVMVTPDGIAKLLDFGLARQSREPRRREVTRRGDVMGTSGWMSPEQLRGEELDARCDAWAFGCLLYECLAGAQAFPGDTEAERDAATLKDEPAWERLPQLSASVLDLLRSCLSKDRAGRPHAMDEARHVLEEARLRSTDRRAVAALPKHFLPAERDAFVGREAELAELGRLLDERHRLVSVLGLGGTGKTRLVTRLAWTRLGAWPGGAWFCDLSESRSVDGICSAVAHALDVPLGKDEPIVQLGQAIAGRGKCLVILDNFEQVARHAPETLGRWLDRAGEAQFVVTTREVLGLPGETALALAPLREDEALDLFVARAVQAKRDFVLTEADRPHVEALVKLLDHLPLAIELAAARVRVMPPRTLLQRMSERFKVLTSSGGRHARQATLHATLDWSWNLLSADEQHGLAQLSVFEGGFSLESAEAVLSLAEAWQADVVQSLVDKSLVRRVVNERFDLLVSVQEYAAAKLEALVGRAEAEARHGRHFAACGTEEALDALATHGGVARRQALVLELANLVSACRRATGRGDGPTAVATFAAAASVLGMNGPFLLAAELGKQVLELGTHETAERCRVLNILGDALRQASRMDEARHALEESLAIHRETGNRRSEGRVLGSLGALHLTQGGSDEALQHFQEAIAIHREVGNRTNEGNMLANLGLVHRRQGRMEEGLRHYQEALAIHREVGNRRSEGVVHGNLGGLHMDQGRMEEGLRHYQEALAIDREVGDRSGEGVVLGNLGLLHVEQGRMEEALRHYQQALAILREVGDRRSEGNVLIGLGQLHVEQGRMEEALRQYQEALAIARDVGNRRSEGIVLGELGNLHAQQGRIDEAREALAAGEALVRAMDDRLYLGTLLCQRGECERLAGNLPAARARLVEADTLARELAAGAPSELGRKIGKLRAAIDGAIDVPQE